MSFVEVKYSDRLVVDDFRSFTTLGKHEENQDDKCDYTPCRFIIIPIISPVT